VTSGGIAAAAAGALPFVGLMLAIGALSALFDLRALISRGAVRGPLRMVSRALVIAWATLPELLRAVRRVRVARQLRGEGGAGSLIVPVLETTVERAVGLGSAMEVRGFAATRRAEPLCERPASLRRVALGHDGREVLAGIDLDISPGTLTLLTGVTGSGKSTLMDALSGLFQHSYGGTQVGTIEVAGVDRERVPPRETAGFVGVVAQTVRQSFVAATVAEEIGFALANRGVAAVVVSARVDEVADRLGIRHLLDSEIVALSAGEACLVAIGSALVEHPVLLLVDEPLADLDEPGRDRIIDTLDRLAHEAGMSVVVAEHALEGWGARPDVWLRLNSGSVERLRGAPPQLPTVVNPPAFSHGDTVVQVRDLSVSHGDVQAVVQASLSLRAGEIVALHGPNGVGKSSLLNAIALPDRPGVVTVDGRDVHALHRRDARAAVALVPEAFDDLLFSTTVAEECRRADRRAPTPGTATMFLRLLGSSEGEQAGLLERHPRDLSRGERLCLVLAIQLSGRPRVLLIDEPTRGLDATARALVAGALLEAAASGTAVLMATHDRSFAARCASRTIAMDSGRVRADAEVAP
ncbi:MAG: ATP-binding cassette domain-containing protein, partial [Rhodoglobus sp.]